MIPEIDRSSSNTNISGLSLPHENETPTSESHTDQHKQTNSESLISSSISPILNSIKKEEPCAPSENTTSPRSSCASDAVKKSETNWQNMFYKLEKFKQEYGHCNVPAKYDYDRKLGMWVSTQRKNLKGWLKGMLTNKKQQKRCEALNAIGFVWKAPRCGGPKPNEMRWMKMYEELKKYKDKFGHCDVRQNDPDHPKLSTWVHTQRILYKNLLKSQKTNALSEHRLKDLEKIGFNWDVPKSRFLHNDTLWMERFQQLQAFKTKYGNFKVPSKYDDAPGLGAWVHRNREQYKLFVRNSGKRKSSMTKERKEALDSIGFFDPEGDLRDDDIFGHSAWLQFYELLKNFRSIEGHCDVPVVYEKNQDLSDWVKVQRIHYDDAKIGKQSLLSRKRMKALDEIDFALKTIDKDQHETLGNVQVAESPTLMCVPSLNVTIQESDSLESDSEMNCEEKKMWLCDVCRVALFEIYEDACKHENECMKKHVSGAV